MKRILMMRAFPYVTALSVLSLAPFALAASGGSIDIGTDNVATLVPELITLVNELIILVAGVAMVVFIWSLVRFLASAEDSGARKEWRQYMIFSIIAFAVITGLWGLTNALLAFVGLPAGTITQFPTTDTSGSSVPTCDPSVDPNCTD